MAFDIVPSADYQRIFLTDHPLMDCRAPIEFSKGAFRSAVNLPLMIDSERHKVGICYKEKGQQAAIELGQALISDKTKQQRIDAWLTQINRQPDTYLYCFRGGLRSQITQQWIKEAGLHIPFIEGGYKGMRQYLIDVIEDASVQQKILILSGSTGCGKTEFISHRAEAIDLEDIANHRGSSAGKKHSPQPTQINFENQLAIDLLKHQQKLVNYLLLEDESFLIGRAAIPKCFYQTMQQSNVVVLTEARDARLLRLLEDYVHFMHQGYISHFGEDIGLAAFEQYLRQSIHGIKKRLGGKLHDILIQLIEDALKIQQRTGDTSPHLKWIEILLDDYYDPMYRYQMNKKQGRILFQGSHQQMHEWLNEYQSS